MKIIGQGTQYSIFDSSISTYSQLPAAVYSVVFNQNTGWSLVQTGTTVEINEKIYGVHENKANKVIHSFERANRNLGVILSGDKGIGKSLFAKLLSKKMLETGRPLIIVDSYIPGIAAFLSSIEQEAVVLFDEFDKIFAPQKTEYTNTPSDPQVEMLTLFDGVFTGKKLFIVTCNDLIHLNDFIINRPGRFHYHFRFEYPSPEEISTYLKDNKITDKEQIEKVVEFSRKVKLNYDCLRAIAFELEDGEDFAEVIKDLNIVDMNQEDYIVRAIFPNGETISSSITHLNMFSKQQQCVDLPAPKDSWNILATISFYAPEAKYDNNIYSYVITNDKFDYILSDDYDITRQSEEDIEEYKTDNPEYYKTLVHYADLRPSYIVIEHDYGKDLHYML